MILEFTGLRVALGSFSLQIDQLRLESPVTAIFGPSGAGKTTLLETVAGLRRPHAGRIAFDGIHWVDTEARRFAGPEARRIGYVPQDGALFPHFSVQRNLVFGQPREAVPEVFGFEHVVDVLELEPLLRRSATQLSGGEKQRVAIGRALVSAPHLLLLDEPLAGMDHTLRGRVLPYLIRVKREFAVPMLYVTHTAEEVVALCDHVVRLEHGQIVGQGSPPEIFRVSAEPRYELRPPAV